MCETSSYIDVRNIKNIYLLKSLNLDKDFM